MTSSAIRSGVFCDFLDVTYSPENFPLREITKFVTDSGGLSLKSSDKQLFKLGSGTMALEERARFARISLSGQVLSYFRSIGMYMELLFQLADAPHKVTRVDAALDLHTDAVPILRSLVRRYPKQCALSRKSQKTSTFFEAREPDGLRSGTFYVGHKSRAECSARVYDKSWEALKMRGEELPRTTRYEITVRKGFSPTLKDAAKPESMFWHFAAPSLLKRPSGVPDWVPEPLDGWVLSKPDIEPAEALKRLIYSDPNIATMARYVNDMGPLGRAHFEKLIMSRLDAEIRNLDS